MSVLLLQSCYKLAQISISPFQDNIYLCIIVLLLVRKPVVSNQVITLNVAVKMLQYLDFVYNFRELISLFSEYLDGILFLWIIVCHKFINSARGHTTLAQKIAALVIIYEILLYCL